jgi:peptide/nickel transport system substrate-binding protein
MLGIASSALGALLEKMPGTALEPVLAAPSPRKGGRLVFAARQDVDTIDPHMTHLKATRQLLNNIFEPLVRHRPGDERVYPGLAESWSISPDARIYTFKLRRGVKFHDGTTLDAQAVKFSFDRIMSDEAAKSVARAFIGPFQRAEVLDKYTVRISFSRPFAAFLALAGLETFAPVSPAAVRRLGKTFGFQPVGTGPFKVKEWVQKSHITLVRNPDYQWAPQIFSHRGPAYLDEVVWRIVPEAGTRVGLSESGEAAIVEEPGFADLERLQASPNLRLFKSIPRGSAWVVHLNVKLAPTNELAIRQAVLFAVNKQAIAKTVFRGFTEPAHSPLQSTMEGYNRDLAGMYSYDVSRAQKLLDEAGWKAGSDGIREKAGRRLSLKWDTDIQGGFPEMAELVQAQLRGVGIEVVVQKVTETVWIDEYFKGVLNFGEIIWWFPAPTLLRTMFGSKSVWNGSKWTSTKMDTLLDTADATVDTGKRNALYRDAQELAMKEAVILPLVANPTVHVLKKSVEGYATTYLGFPLFYDVSLTS